MLDDRDKAVGSVSKGEPILRRVPNFDAAEMYGSR